MASFPFPKATDPGAIVLTSQGFAGWLAAKDCVVARTTYQAGCWFLIGRKPDGSVRAHERLIDQSQVL